MTETLSNLRLVAFDADDTLWDCQGHFDAVEEAYCQILSPYGEASAISKSLYDEETSNMPILGFGSKAFTISLVENAIKVSKGTVSNQTLGDIIKLGKSLLQLPATPLPGVSETLAELRNNRNYDMVVFTKGDNLDQETKFHKSGLDKYFDDIIVVSDKNETAYERLCQRFGIGINELCMVGNSYKSDIKPVLDLGGNAVHIPYSISWEYEHIDEEPDEENDRLSIINNFSELTDIL